MNNQTDERATWRDYVISGGLFLLLIMLATRCHALASIGATP